MGFIGIVFVCSNFSCHHLDYPRHFKIKNNSNTSIFYAYSYPDTSLAKINNIPYSNENQTHNIIAKDSLYEGTNVLELNPICLMFIFNANTIETTPWDSIVKHYTVLKRYQLTKSDMEKSNWTITYP